MKIAIFVWGSDFVAFFTKHLAHSRDYFATTGEIVLVKVKRRNVTIPHHDQVGI